MPQVSYVRKQKPCGDKKIWPKLVPGLEFVNANSLMPKDGYKKDFEALVTGFASANKGTIILKAKFSWVVEIVNPEAVNQNWYVYKC